MEETTHDVHYTISNLSPNTVYRVCVTARDGHGNTHSHWMHCANITTGMSCELYSLYKRVFNSYTNSRVACCKYFVPVVCVSVYVFILESISFERAMLSESNSMRRSRALISRC